MSNFSQKVRVLGLYRWLLREADKAPGLHLLPFTRAECRAKVKEQFLTNKDVTDSRVIDMMIIRGKLVLDEIHNGWSQQSHIISFFQKSDEIVKNKKKNTFIGQFVNEKANI